MLLSQVSCISLRRADAGGVLAQSREGGFDLVFLDAERSEYRGWWSHWSRVLRPGGMLVVDNATSHPEQMAPFISLVRTDTRFATRLVPAGNGGFLGAKSVA